MYRCIHVYMSMCIYIYIYIYILAAVFLIKIPRRSMIVGIVAIPD